LRTIWLKMSEKKVGCYRISDLPMTAVAARH
jgi:hypothetical protein